MSHRILYFPYIKVPEGAWLTQALLYWDQVSSIVPYEYLSSPERLGPYMQALLREELVWQVQPGAFLFEIPRFREAFVSYLQGLGAGLPTRLEAFRNGKVVRIHLEKMGKLVDDLKDAGLAAPSSSYPWFDVEAETAQDFMCYLATALGQLDRIDSLPMTDTGDMLHRTLGPGASQGTLDELRIEVLDRILPIPTRAVPPAELARFKAKHGAALIDFRLRVEQELVGLAQMGDLTLRERAIELFAEEANQRTAEIRSWLRESRWQDGLAKFGGIISAVPGVAPVLGLLNAVREAFVGSRAPQPSRDFAYAAHIEAQLVS
jgi:hypothetical protein